MIELEAFYQGEGFFVFFVLVVTVFIALESLVPLYKPHGSILGNRWLVNFSLYFFGALTVYVGVDQLTDWTMTIGFGLFHMIEAPLFVQIVCFFLLADFLQYVVHVASHRYALLWRLHMAHHTDLDIDSTTTFRHHPLENLIDYAIKIVALLLIGASLPILIVHDLVLAVQTLFTHSNLALPTKIERQLRKVIITSDMHRIHHSVDPQFTNSNYATFFSFWDRLFGTYQDIPQAEQKTMQLGLEYYRDKKDQTLLSILIQPFKKIPQGN